MAGFNITVFIFLNMFGDYNLTILTDTEMYQENISSYSNYEIEFDVHTIYVEFDHPDGYIWSTSLEAAHVSIGHLIIGQDVVYMTGIFWGRLTVGEKNAFSSRPRSYMAAFSEDGLCLYLTVGEIGFTHVSAGDQSEIYENSVIFDNKEIIETEDPSEPSDPVDPDPPTNPPPGGGFVYNSPRL